MESFPREFRPRGKASAIVGALIGTRICAGYGIAGGPGGAIVDTIPGAIIGAIVGGLTGDNNDSEICVG